MRSKPITIALLSFCFIAPIFGCCWSWFVTLQFYGNRISLIMWLWFNPIIYIGLTLYFYRHTIRIHHEKWENTINTIIALLGLIFSFAATISVLLAYRTGIWVKEYEPADTVAGGDATVLMIVGIINGILIGLTVLTMGYRWLPQNKRKPKV